MPEGVLISRTVSSQPLSPTATYSLAILRSSQGASTMLTVALHSASHSSQTTQGDSPLLPRPPVPPCQGPMLAKLQHQELPLHTPHTPFPFSMCCCHQGWGLPADPALIKTQPQPESFPGSVRPLNSFRNYILFTFVSPVPSMAPAPYLAHCS